MTQTQLKQSIERLRAGLFERETPRGCLGLAERLRGQMESSIAEAAKATKGDCSWLHSAADGICSPGFVVIGACDLPVGPDRQEVKPESYSKTQSDAPHAIHNALNQFAQRLEALKVQYENIAGSGKSIRLLDGGDRQPLEHFRIALLAQ